MFRTDVLSIIRSLNTVFTAIGICGTEVIKMGKITSGNHSQCHKTIKAATHYRLKQGNSNFTHFKNFSMTNTNCCEYSIRTPDDGQ